MGREYRVLSVLYKQFPLAPRAYFYCEDKSVIGATFEIGGKHEPNPVLQRALERIRAGRDLTSIVADRPRHLVAGLRRLGSELDVAAGIVRDLHRPRVRAGSDAFNRVQAPTAVLALAPFLESDRELACDGRLDGDRDRATAAVPDLRGNRLDELRHELTGIRAGISNQTFVNVLEDASANNFIIDVWIECIGTSEGEIW